MYKFAFTAVVFLLPVLASAHVTVIPDEIGIWAYQTFTLSVPTEKEIATTEVRLLIPEGLENVRPNVKPDWNVQIVTTGEGDGARVTQLIWNGGLIPADQRDEFFFSAKAPLSATSFQWNAYQTYEDGTLVSWDQEATEHEEDEFESKEDELSGPASVTRVVNDLADTRNVIVAAPIESMAYRPVIWWDCWIILSLIMSGAALFISIRNSLRANLNS